MAVAAGLGDQGADASGVVLRDADVGGGCRGRHHRYLGAGGGRDSGFGTIILGEAALAFAAALLERFGPVYTLDQHDAAIAAIDALCGDRVIRGVALSAGEAARLALDLLHALLAAGERASQARPAPPRGDRARQALERHWREDDAIARAAAQLGLGRERLGRIFKERHGLTPSAWIRRRRVREACLLLGDRSQPVKSIAQRVGYGSAAAFCRAFQREMGMTPEAWRALARYGGIAAGPAGDDTAASG